MAITVGQKIHLYNTSRKTFLNNIPWLCHELKHVQQYRQYGYWNFIFIYLKESFRKGYYNNKWEMEARLAEQDKTLLKQFEII